MHIGNGNSNNENDNADKAKTLNTNVTSNSKRQNLFSYSVEDNKIFIMVEQQTINKTASPLRGVALF